MKDICLRCGKCCHYIHRGQLKVCKYLRQIGNNKTGCIIYPRRLGKTINRNPYVKCGFRDASPYNFEGCPYNKKEKISFEKVVESLKK